MGRSRHPASCCASRCRGGWRSAAGCWRTARPPGSPTPCSRCSAWRARPAAPTPPPPWPRRSPAATAASSSGSPIQRRGSQPVARRGWCRQDAPMSLLALALLPLLAQETIPLRADPKAAAALPEQVVDRGTGGNHDRAVSQVSRPSLTVYLPAKDKATGTAVVVCPGGGYERLAFDKEGHEVARWLTSVGIAGIVLKYRLPGKDNMKLAKGELHQATKAAHVAVEDAEEAMRVVRENAARWNIRPNAVGMMGFSAG